MTDRSTAPAAVTPTAWASPQMQARIRRRYRQERLFKLTGMGALALAAGFLVFLIQTTANPHMYARMWIVPVLLMMGLAYRTGRGRTRLHQIPGQELTTP